MNKGQGNNNNDDNDKEDCKPTAKEKKQAEEAQDTSDSDDDGPMKKKRKMESFSLGCEVLCQHIELMVESHHTFEVQPAHQQVAELDAIRREYQCTIDAYEDLYSRYRNEFGLHRMYKYLPMRLGEMQQNQKRKNQLLFAIGSMLKVETMEYPMTCPLSSEQDLFFNKWKLSKCYKYNLINKMPEGDEKDQEDAKFWWSVETDCFTRVFGDEMKAYLEMMTMCMYTDQVIFKKEESSGDELQEDSSSSEEEEEEEPQAEEKMR